MQRRVVASVMLVMRRGERQTCRLVAIVAGFEARPLGGVVMPEWLLIRVVLTGEVVVNRRPVRPPRVIVVKMGERIPRMVGERRQ